jgi:choline dehydrogenase-like flavoprotein
MTLAPARLAVLEALCRRMVPLADAPDPAAKELARAVQDRLAAAPPADARRVGVILELLDHPATALVGHRSLQRFTRLDARGQDARLREMETSALPPVRTLFQALRRLILSTHYARPASHASIGYLGPLHTREPAVAWEGPLPGADGTPVAPRVLHPTARELRVFSDNRATGITEGARLAGDTRIRADVCVIGTGAGGAVAAARLAEAGHQVVILEEGGHWRGEDFTEDEATMTTRLYADAGARATDDLAIPILQGRAVGGSTTVNWMLMLRTPEWVLDEWAAEHGAEGMSAAEMAPVFERIEGETHTREVPGDAHNPANRALLDGARALGWSAGAGRINAQGCVRSGFCGLGCRYDAKQGTAATFIPAALASGARLYADVRAERIEQVERGGRAPLKRVHATVLDRLTGAPRGRVVVEAPIVVLGAGAVGTPALLQRSGMGGGGVGRFLRLHPTTAVVGRYGHETYPAGGIPLSAVCDQFLRGADGYGFWIECPPYYPALAAVAYPGFGAEHREAMESFRRSATFIVLVRDGADRLASNGEVRVDRTGRIRIRYRLGPAEHARMARGIAAAARLHLAAGAEEARTLHTHGRPLRSVADLASIAALPAGPNQLGVLSAHVNGTCRMGRDPRTAGCTPHGERFGAPGVYVVDGSLLPTAPGVNPQETIMALASVVAARIAERHPAGRAGSAGALTLGAA